MSHNNTKVNSQNPDVSGNITLTVSNLVSGTPSENDTIKYNGTSWEVTSLSSDIDFLYIINSTLNAYLNSGASSTTSGSWNFYGDNIINNIGAIINKQSGK